jgi:hypothetical protein
MNKRALAIARSCGLRGFDVEDAAEQIAWRWKEAPTKNRLRLASGVMRRFLARLLSKPQRSLPSDLVSLSAIGQYEIASRRYDEAGMWGSFSIHDRRFATENGVCPRCSSSSGSFGDVNGSCPCGFGY